jgi:hypothetical protein
MKQIITVAVQSINIKGANKFVSVSRKCGRKLSCIQVSIGASDHIDDYAQSNSLSV